MTAQHDRRALVVANARYDDPALAALRAPTHDADALARVLGDPEIGGFDVELLMDADERTVRRRVAGFFAGSDRDDLLLLHFSCHGVKDRNGRLYLAARDTDLESLSATGVAAAFVDDQLAQTRSKRVILVLDCCYSGAFTRGMAPRADRSVHIGDEFGVGSGRIVLTASSATEYAFEGTDLTRADAGTSVFTTALVGGLETGDADLGGDGEISVDELYDYTYREVKRRTPAQTPMKWTFGVEGTLTVARSVRSRPSTSSTMEKAPAPPTPQPPPPPPSPRGTMTHSALFVVLVAVGLIALLQAVEMMVVGFYPRWFSGVDPLGIMPVVAAAALYTSIRARAWLWSAGAAGVLAINVWWSAAMLAGNELSSDDVLVGTLVWIIDGETADQGNTVFWLRLAVSVPPMLWFAIAGPAAPPRRWPIRRFLRRPGLAVGIVIALAVSLTGTGTLVPVGGDSFEFALVRPLHANGNGVVGLGNAISTYTATGYSWRTALWCMGWLALLVMAAVVLVALIRGRRLLWTAVVGAGVLASLVAGDAAGGFYPRGEQDVLAAYLAVATACAGAGVLAYAIRGPAD